MGGSVVTQLVKQGARVTVGATRQEGFERARLRWKENFESLAPQLDEVDFQLLDRESADSVAGVLSKTPYDLVVHTAGPFQGKAKVPNGVLDAAVVQGVAYIDVCDDYCTAMAAKSKFSEKAMEAGTPCIISTGCWVSWINESCRREALPTQVCLLVNSRACLH